MKIKLSYITGLRSVVLDELKKAKINSLYEIGDSVYVEFSLINFQSVKKLRSIARAYLVVRENFYNPTYISSHKSLLSEIIDVVIVNDKFKTFKITCAGSDSTEVRSIASFVQNKYKLQLSDEADLKIHLIKHGVVWEMGVQITPRPLSFRSYKVANMKGAMDPTIAYAVNSLCVSNVGSATSTASSINNVNSYFNIFSGSGTLLIEVAECFPNIEKVVGFDNDKNHLTLSIQNIKKAGLIKRILVKEGDIFDKPDLGKFDVITSDLPFGMSVSKNQDLQKLYVAFIEYCERVLNVGGRLVIYTSEFEIIESLIFKSEFKIIESLQLKLSTSVGSYLKPKIIVCEFR